MFDLFLFLIFTIFNSVFQNQNSAGAGWPGMHDSPNYSGWVVPTASLCFGRCRAGYMCLQQLT
jgi:hypothetical protein